MRRRARKASIGQPSTTAIGPVHAVNDLSLQIALEEFVAVLGPGDCGKSTVLMMIAGLLEVSAGTITIGEATVTRLPTDLDIVFQSHVLLEWRSMLENVLLREEVSVRAVGQHAATCVDLPSATARSANPTDGRAIWRMRSRVSGSALTWRSSG